MDYLLWEYRRTNGLKLVDLDHAVTGAQLREAIEQRLLNLTDDELVEAVGMPFDSYEEIQ